MPKKTKSQLAATDDYGHILAQTKWWKRGTGELIRRKDMNIKYKLNALAYLFRQADGWHAQRQLALCVFNPPDDVMDEIMRESAEEWMLEQPMTRALILDIMEFASVTPEEVGLVAIPGAMVWGESVPAFQWDPNR